MNPRAPGSSYLGITRDFSKTYQKRKKENNNTAKEIIEEMTNFDVRVFKQRRQPVIRKECTCTHVLLQTGNKKVNEGLKRD